MDLGIQGRTAIVTGSARGIGAAITRRLAAEGVRVVVTDIRPEGVMSAVAELQQSGVVAHGVTADITKRAEVESLVEETLATFGSIDILVNNAGLPRDKFLTKMSDEDWDIVLEVALKGSFLAARAVMPHMIAQQWGRVINISSRAYLGNPGQANYSTAKAGLLGLTRALAIEEGRYNITVNAVAPGFISTEMIQALPNYETIRDRAVKATPIPRPGHPNDIADAVAFLASERASYITGETLHVTGGRYG
jgi:3-oxoacyl-[acyl-carrier protein] reductase